ncbi:hypothetical protein [Paeniglutamicibacter cryotolerans]|uniref:Type III secretory pathway component EscS n=1 Tax=Paeniglutamicibacter cryotolerans TaxID=670079 RepID=A0A839QHP7_9MICC|nr:hypothetical protein [Paeniglutamicibacter cryotolerans]MBB2995410.1 type III secretory pathway component EscS [Paeniglutamicibacter cryotolerans]
MNTSPATPTPHRMLVLSAVAIAAVSLLSLITSLIQYAFSVQPWTALFAIALYGLPVAFILLMVVLGLTWFERRRS